MDRFEKIRNYKAKLNRENLDKETLLKQKYEDCLTKIRLLKPRIDYLLKLANCCRENGIPIGTLDSDRREFKWQKGFITKIKTDGFEARCGIGFLYKNCTYASTAITEIGTRDDSIGDFHTNGEDTYFTSWYGEDRSNPHIVDMIEEAERFINKFVEFEENFLEFVDDITREKK